MQRHIAICVAFGLIFSFVAFVLLALFGFWISHDTGLGSALCTRGGAEVIYRNLIIALVGGGGLLFSITFSFRRMARASFVTAYTPPTLVIMLLVHSAVSHDGRCFWKEVERGTHSVDFSDWAGRYVDALPDTSSFSGLLILAVCLFAVLSAIFVACRGPISR